MRFYCNSILFYIIINISAYPDVKRGRLATYPDLTIYVRATLEFVMKLQKKEVTAPSANCSGYYI